MKFNRKNTGIALVSILTAVTAISSSVRAERFKWAVLLDQLLN